MYLLNPRLILCAHHGTHGRERGRARVRAALLQLSSVRVPLCTKRLCVCGFWSPNFWCVCLQGCPPNKAATQVFFFVIIKQTSGSIFEVGVFFRGLQSKKRLSFVMNPRPPRTQKTSEPVIPLPWFASSGLGWFWRITPPTAHEAQQ